ncbi:MAG: hypothetical protein H7259_03895 [Cytophagales bacterium]|nr:hypothetical protein [Cytophaga sp.]
MKPSTVLSSGFAGAVAVSAIHETIRRIYPAAPRMDLLGKQSLAKVIHKAGGHTPTRTNMYAYTLAADLLGNTLFYSLSGIGKNKNVFAKGAALGLLAGVGAVVLPKYLGLNESYSNRTLNTKAITVGLYVIGGIVTASVLYFMNRKKTSHAIEDERHGFEGTQVIGYDEQ